MAGRLPKLKKSKFSGEGEKKKKKKCHVTSIDQSGRRRNTNMEEGRRAGEKISGAGQGIEVDLRDVELKIVPAFKGCGTTEPPPPHQSYTDCVCVRDFI